MNSAKINRGLVAANYETRSDRSVAWMLALMLMLVFLPVMGVWVAAFLAH